jgi:uncharacterized protein (DUF4415 family)
MEEEQIINRKRGQRGPGKKPALVHVTLRIPAETLEFYRRSGWASNAMREALVEFAKKHS